MLKEVVAHLTLHIPVKVDEALIDAYKATDPPSQEAINALGEAIELEVDNVFDLEQLEPFGAEIVSFSLAADDAPITSDTSVAADN